MAYLRKPRSRIENADEKRQQVPSLATARSRYLSPPISVCNLFMILGVVLLAPIRALVACLDGNEATYHDEDRLSISSSFRTHFHGKTERDRNHVQGG